MLYLQSIYIESRAYLTGNSDKTDFLVTLCMIKVIWTIDKSIWITSEDTPAGYKELICAIK